MAKKAKAVAARPRQKAKQREEDQKRLKDGRIAAAWWIYEQEDTRTSDLRRLAEAFDGVSLEKLGWFNADASSAFGVARDILGIIRGDSDLNDHESTMFWLDTISEERPDGFFLFGFVESALEIWQEIKSREDCEGSVEKCRKIGHTYT